MRPGSDDARNDPEKRRVIPNALLAATQVVVTGVTLFLLYRFLYSHVGVEALGVWSLVVAATSVATASSLGLAGGTVRFVSRYLAHGDARAAAGVVETATLSIALLTGVGAAALWPVGSWLIGWVVPSQWADEARRLLPFTLAALWFNGVGGAIHSGLSGCHRAGTSSSATMAVQPLLLLVAWWLVPEMGLRGMAVAQVAQQSIWLVLGWMLLRRLLPLSCVPRRWSRDLFLEMWRYGLNFQVISILVVLTDPLAKGLLSHFGGLSAVGYFEMANRLVSQVRTLLVSANQVMVPYYAKVSETSRKMLRSTYERNASALVPLASLAFSTLLGLLPLVSVLWTGGLNSEFIVYAALLTGGWYMNTLCGPAFFANLGSGAISRNVIGHLCQTTAVLVFGVVGGTLAGAIGGVLAYVLALCSGSLLIVAMFHRLESIPLSVLVSTTLLRSLALGTGLAVSGWGSFVLISGRAGVLAAMVVCVLVVVAWWAILFILIHELRNLGRTVTSQLRESKDGA
jgi:O-antigen/teichoic acid export membrane protein